jgi:hypothetical protein
MKVYQDIDPAEFIDVRFWESLAADTSCEFCPSEHIPELFRKPSKLERSLISAYCDCSIMEQDEHHPNMDLGKILNRLPWQEAMNRRDSYSCFRVDAGINPALCVPSDKYSSKIDSYTYGTFPCLPEWLNMWYAVNLNIVHEQCQIIPFGLNDDGHGSSILHTFRGREKKKLLYVNFQDNTSERIMLKQYYSKMPWVTYRDTANLPVEQFYAEMSEHMYVLSPFGNGLDCYRNYEAMYLGCIPILQQSTFANNLHQLGIPMLSVKHLAFDKSFEIELRNLHKMMSDADTMSAYAPLTRKYWSDRLALES